MIVLAPLYLIAWMLGGIGYCLLAIAAKERSTRVAFWWGGFLILLFGMLKINSSDVLW